jgi:hypothetical protein
MRGVCRGVFLAVALAGSCQPADPPGVYLGPPGTTETHAVVEVAQGSVTSAVWRLRSTVLVEGVTRTALLPERPPDRPLGFPATYTILTRDRTGTVHVEVDALGQDGQAVGRGRGSAELVPNRGVHVGITLAPACSTPADCGDGTWCNGQETCVEGRCAPGQVPCPLSSHACVDVRCLEEEKDCDVVANHGRCAPQPGSGSDEAYCDVAQGCLPGRPEAPFLVGDAQVWPEEGTVGTTFQVTFEASEPLSVAPVVRLDVGGRRAPLQPVEAQAVGRHHVFQYVVDGSEMAGRRALTVDMVDLSGNAATGLSAGSLVLDFSPPRFSGQPSAAPLALRQGASSRLTVSWNEPLGGHPEARMAPLGQVPGADALAWSLEPGEGDEQHTFTYTTAGTELEGVYVVWLFARDRAGNTTGALEAARIQLDFHPPAILADPGVRVLPPRAAVGQAVSVEVPLDESPVNQPTLSAHRGDDRLVLLPQDAPSRQLVFLHFTEPGQDGTWDLVLDGLTDGAGNTRPPFVVGTLEVDGQPPAVVGFEMSRETLRRGDTLDVTFSTSEVLGAEPSVFLGAVPLARIGSGETPYAYGLTLEGQALAGRVGVVVELVDRVGNWASVHGGVVQVDLVPPEIVAATVSPTPAGLGTTLALTLTPSEPLGETPTLTVAGPAPLLMEHQPGTLYVFRHLVLPTDGQGNYQVTADLVDLAGNRSQGLAVASFSVDVTSPSIVSLTTNQRAFSFQEGHNHLVVDVEVDVDAGESLEAEGLSCRLGAEALACVLTSPTSARCQGAITGGEDGPRVVEVRTRDRAGNTDVATTTVMVDTTAPSLLPQFSAVHVLPAPGSPLEDPASAGAGARVVLAFVTDEPLGQEPTVYAEGLDVVAFTLEGSSGTSFTFAGEVPGDAPPQEQAYQLRVVMTDALANRRDQVLAVPFTVDTVPPALVGPDARANLVYLRNPWGTDATGGVPAWWLEAAPAGTVEPGCTVLVLAEPAYSRSAELGRTRAGADGSIPRTSLAGEDHPVVYVMQVDGAGNVDGVPTPVKTVRWTATMAGKVPGSVQRNPHRFLAWTVEPPSLWAPDQEGSEQGSPGVALQGDGGAALVTGDNSWVPVRRGSGPGARESPGLAFHPTRGRVVLFGGRSATQIHDDTWEWTGEGWVAHTLAVKPAARFITAMAYDPAQDEVVLFGGFAFVSGFPVYLGDTWTWEGLRWTRHVEATGPQFLGGCAMAYHGGWKRVALVCPGGTWSWSNGAWENQALPPPAGLSTSFSMAYDDGRGVMVMHDDNGSTFELAGGAWGPPHSDGPGAGALAYDENRAQVTLWTDQGRAWRWDGTAWASLGLPEPLPAAQGRSAVGDHLRGRVVVLGDSTWEWDGTDVAQVDPVAALPDNPACTMAAVPGQRALAVFTAGQAWVRTLGGTWRSAGALPAGISSCSMVASDPSGGPLVCLTADLQYWTWDGEHWDNPAGSNPPPVGSSGRALAYHGATGQLVLAGGSTTPSNRVFIREEGTWRPFWTDGEPVVPLPPSTSLADMAYNPTLQRVVYIPGAILNGIWTYDGAAWSMDSWGSSLVPFRAAFEPGLDRVVFTANGGPTGQAVGVVDAGGVVTAGLDTRPPMMFGSCLAHDPGTGHLVVHGSAPGLLDTTWEWVGTTRRPAQAMVTDLEALDLPHLATVTRVRLVAVSGGAGLEQGQTVTGAQLRAWGSRGWEVVDQHQDDDAHPGLLEWSTSDPSRLERLVVRSQVALQVVPVGLNGWDHARLATDYAQVTVTYDLP